MADVFSKIKEYIPGTQEAEAAKLSRYKANEVTNKWSSGETVYSQIRQRLDINRAFYMGEQWAQFNANTTEGKIRVTANVGATVVDLMVFLLTNGAITIQAKPNTNDETSQIEASIGEELANKILKDADFAVKFKEMVWILKAAGFVDVYPFWNNRKEFGKKRNKFDFTVLNPYNTRVFFKDSDYTQVECFIVTSRATPLKIYEDYEGFVAQPDFENPFVPREIQNINDGMCTIYKHYDDKIITHVIDGRVARQEEHGLDFTPVFSANNKYVVNEARGLDEYFRFMPLAQELNMLISSTSEIARDLAYPALIEYNGAFGNRDIDKLRGKKIPARRTERGESVEFLINPAQVAPLLNQIELLLELFHFVSLMPKAAAGIFDSSVTSGFQARIAMQPATLNTNSNKLDLEVLIIKLVKTGLYLLEKNNPKALIINENLRVGDLHDLDFEVKWADSMPVDVAREIQNLILGIQNSLTSVTQAVDKYNVLMNMGSTEETKQYLRQESTDSNLAPDRALKVAQVQQALANINKATEGIRESLNVRVNPDNILPGGNATNATRALGGRLEEEKKQAPDTAREAVAPESTGGKVISSGEVL